MKFVNLLVLLVLLSGCAFTKYVDAKGRDCSHNMIFPVKWDECVEEKEPLAITRQEIKVDANVEQK
jgi:hypothetical protein